MKSRRTGLRILVRAIPAPLVPVAARVLAPPLIWPYQRISPGRTRMTPEPTGRAASGLNPSKVTSTSNALRIAAKRPASRKDNRTHDESIRHWPKKNLGKVSVPPGQACAPGSSRHIGGAGRSRPGSHGWVPSRRNDCPLGISTADEYVCASTRQGGPDNCQRTTSCAPTG